MCEGVVVVRDSERVVVVVVVVRESEGSVKG